MIPTYQQIKHLCQEQGNFDMGGWETEFHNRLIEAIIELTSQARKESAAEGYRRYRTDSTYHAQVLSVVRVVMATLGDERRSKLNKKLNQSFRDGIEGR